MARSKWQGGCSPLAKLGAGSSPFTAKRGVVRSQEARARVVIPTHHESAINVLVHWRPGNLALRPANPSLRSRAGSNP
jgi:hypothetical protein